EQFQLVSGNFLFLDGDDLADAVRRIDDMLAGLEPLTLCRLLLLGCHTPKTPVLNGAERFARRAGSFKRGTQRPDPEACRRDRRAIAWPQVTRVRIFDSPFSD